MNKNQAYVTWNTVEAPTVITELSVRARLDQDLLTCVSNDT